MLKHKGGDVLPVHGDWHPVSIVQGRKSRNLFNVNDRWPAQWDSAAIVDDDGWIYLEADNTSGTGYKFVNFWTYVSNELKPSTDYLIVCEIEQIDTLVIVAVGADTANSKAQFYPSWTLKQSDGTRVHAKVMRTVSDFSDKTTMLRGYAYLLAGQKGKAKFRMSVLEDTSITPQTFKYEPYGTVTDPIFTPAEQTKSGASVEFEDTYNDAAEIEVAGKTSQQSYAGKNILPNRYANPIAQVGTHTRNGLTFIVYEDGSIQVDGTATASSDFDLFYGSVEQYDFAQVKAGDTIYASNMGGGIGITIALRVGDNRTQRVQTYDQGYFTATSDGRLQAWLLYKEGMEIHTLVRPMVNIGSDYATYEPYVGGIPSPSPDYPQPIESIESVELSSRGRNLLPPQMKTNASYFTINGDGTINADIPANTGTSTRWIDYTKNGANTVLLKPNTRYTVSWSENVGFTKFLIRTGTPDGYSQPVYADANGGGSVTFTTVNKELTFTQVSFTQASGSPALSGKFWVQIVEGDEAHPYEPHHSSSRTIDLQGHELRSLPDGTHDELLVHRDGRVELVQMVTTGTISDFVGWGQASEYSQLGGISIYAGYATVEYWLDGIATGKRSNLLCNKLKASGGNSFETSNGAFILQYESGLLVLHDPKAATLAEARANMKAANLEIQYELATPQTIQLPSIDPLPTYHPYTFIDGKGVDLTARVRVIE